eukprot:1625382-Amphidinium_carterae.1
MNPQQPTEDGNAPNDQSYAISARYHNQRLIFQIPDKVQLPQPQTDAIMVLKWQALEGLQALSASVSSAF